MNSRAVLCALACLVVVAGAVFVRGRAAPVSSLSESPRQIVAGPHGLFWIEPPPSEPPGPARLQYLPPGAKKPTCLLQAHDVRSIAVGDGTLYVLAETGPQEDAGVMVAVDLSSGERRFSAAGLYRPQSLEVDGGTLYWTESRSARAEGIVHVPIIKPVNAIRAGAQPSEPTLIGLTEGSEPHFTGALLGAREGKLYWTERLGWEYVGGATLIKRGGGDGSDPELLARTNGHNVAALEGDALYFTAYSRELASPSAGRLVNRMDLSASHTEMLTDWLDTNGALLVARGTPLYVDASYLWRIPSRLDPPIPVKRLGAMSPPVVAAYRGNLYTSRRMDERVELVRVPLGLRGYLNAALPLGRLRAKVGQISLTPLSAGIVPMPERLSWAGEPGSSGATTVLARRPGPRPSSVWQRARPRGDVDPAGRIGGLESPPHRRPPGPPRATYGCAARETMHLASAAGGGEAR
jgi:hypothetical protein